MLAKMHALTSLQRSSLSSSVFTNGMLRSLAAALLQSQAGLACADVGRRVIAPVTTLQTSCSLPAILKQCLDVHAGTARMHSLVTSAEVYNIPNALSLARLVSGPGIAWLILNEHWGLALGSLVISGASDWADGFVAKRYGQSSVLGSFLDPLADKALIGCVVGALGYQGSLPWWLVALIIGRDAALVAGGFVHRFHKVGWRWPGAAEFFRLSASSPSADAASQMQSAGAASSSSAPSTANLIHSTSQQPSSSSSSNAGQENAGKHRKGQAPNSKSSTSVDASIAAISDIGTSKSQQQKPQEQQPQQKDAANAKLKAASEGQSTEPAAFVQPLYISKVNTCFQLLLVGGCLTSSWYAWPPQEVLFGLGVVTGGTTVASSAAYARAYLQGKIK